MEVKSTDIVEQTTPLIESTGVLPDPSSNGRSQYHVMNGMSDKSLEELKIYSRAILYCIVYGSTGENRLLRELYWHTVDALAHLENGGPVEDSRYRS